MRGCQSPRSSGRHLNAVQEKLSRSAPDTASGIYPNVPRSREHDNVPQADSGPLSPGECSIVTDLAIDTTANWVRHGDVFLYSNR
jgi:hypothetical protein